MLNRTPNIQPGNNSVFLWTVAKLGIGYCEEPHCIETFSFYGLPLQPEVYNDHPNAKLSSTKAATNFGVIKSLFPLSLVVTECDFSPNTRKTMMLFYQASSKSSVLLKMSMQA